jgi:hypothetical protein
VCNMEVSETAQFSKGMLVINDSNIILAAVNFMIGCCIMLSEFDQGRNTEIQCVQF